MRTAATTAERLPSRAERVLVIGVHAVRLAIARLVRLVRVVATIGFIHRRPTNRRPTRRRRTTHEGATSNRGPADRGAAAGRLVEAAAVVIAGAVIAARIRIISIGARVPRPTAARFVVVRIHPLHLAVWGSRREGASDCGEVRHATVALVPTESRCCW